MGEWREVPFGSLGELFDGPHATPTRRSKGPYFLNISSLKSGRLHLSESDHVSEEDFEKWTRRVTPQAGDLLFSYETRLGEAALMPDGIRACLGRRMALLRPDPSVVESRFLLYLYLSPSFQRTILERATQGATVPRIGLATMSDWTVMIPVIREQRAIADVLGSLDDKIEVNGRIASSSMELAHSMVLDVMRSAQLDESSVLRARFGDLGKLFDGPHATPPRLSEGPYFLNISSLKFGRLDLKESDHVSENDFEKWVRRVTPEEDDLLFSYETRLGEAALMPGGIRACLGRRMALLRPDQTRVDPVFLLHFYLSPQFQRIIAANTIHGATVPRIGLATMPNWEIEIPTYECQRVISDRLHALQSRMISSERESDQLGMLRDALLPLLMSGKIRVKDAELVVGEVT